MIKKFIENNCTLDGSEIIVCSKLKETFGGNIIEIGAGVEKLKNFKYVESNLLRPYDEL